MTRKKPIKNKNTNDIDREKNLKRRVIEERATAEDTWDREKSRTMEEKIADYIKNKTPEDHITYRILKGVIFKLKYGLKYYPVTKGEKYDEGLALNLLRQKISWLRRDPKYGYLSIGSGIMHENQVTKDIEPIICDMTTEQPKGSKKKSQLLISWEAGRNLDEETFSDGTKMTIENALRPKNEREKLEREEFERRKKRDRNNDGGVQ